MGTRADTTQNRTAAPDVIEAPATGECVTFLQRGEDTDGELLEIEVVAEPFASGPPEHDHERQTEFFEILAGTFTGLVDGEELELTAGDTYTIPAGTPHRWWNAHDEELVARVEVRPALEMAEFLETVYGLARDGKLHSDGGGNPLQMAVIGKHYWDTNHLASPPAIVQKAAFAVLAPIGRLLGYRAYYPEYSPRRRV